MRVRLIRHDTILPDGRSLNCGSFEVRFPDGRPPRYFYWDDLAGRRMRVDQVDSATAEQHAKAFARVEQSKLDLTLLPGAPSRRSALSNFE